MQTTLTRIFIEVSEFQTFFRPKSDDLQKKRSLPILRLIFRQNRKFKRFFRPNSSGLQKKKNKKRSSSILILIFLPKSEIQLFEGGLFSDEGAIFNFSPKLGLKNTKNVRFCILHKPMGGARAAPSSWLRYCILVSNSIHQPKQSFQFQHFNFFLCDNIFLKSKQQRKAS